MGDVPGFAQPTRARSTDDPDGEPHRPEEQPDDGAGQGSFGGSPADHVALIVQVDVAARERAPHHDAVVPVVLDEGDLVHPRRIPRGVQHVGIGVLGARDVLEDQEGEVEAHQIRRTVSSTAATAAT